MEKFSRRTIIGDIYRNIFYSGSASRKQLCETHNLSMPTVTNYLQQLITDGLICIDGTEESTGGRKAITYRCVSTSRYAIGVDLTRNHLNIVLIDILENILDSFRMKIPFKDTDAYFENVAEEIDHMIQSNHLDEKNILGVGISAPVLFESNQKNVGYAEVIKISNDTYKKIEKYIKYPALFFNDANSAGLAEWWKSSSTKTAVYISLNPSIGGATINGNTIYKGDNNRASEFGHIPIVPNGKRCYCGKRGCFDAYCSELVLTNFTDGNISEFFEQAESNEGLSNVLNDYLDHLAMAVNTLRICYDCDVIIGGNVGAHLEKYIDTLKKKTMLLNPFENNADYIIPCSYKNSASAVGAALYYVKEYVENF